MKTKEYRAVCKAPGITCIFIAPDLTKIRTMVNSLGRTGWKVTYQRHVGDRWIVFDPMATTETKAAAATRTTSSSKKRTASPNKQSRRPA